MFFGQCFSFLLLVCWCYCCCCWFWVWFWFWLLFARFRIRRNGEALKSLRVGRGGRVPTRAVRSLAACAMLVDGLLARRNCIVTVLGEIDRGRGRIVSLRRACCALNDFPEEYGMFGLEGLCLDVLFLISLRLFLSTLFLDRIAC